MKLMNRNLNKNTDNAEICAHSRIVREIIMYCTTEIRRSLKQTDTIINPVGFGVVDESSDVVSAISMQ